MRMSGLCKVEMSAFMESRGPHGNGANHFEPTRTGPLESVARGRAEAPDADSSSRAAQNNRPRFSPCGPRIPGCARSTIRLLGAAAPAPRATPFAIPRPAPGSLAACHTGAAADHKTSPTLAPRSPRRFVLSPTPPVPESPSDEFVLSRCDAAPAPTAPDRFAPAGPGSVHRVDHLFACSW